MLEIKEYVNNRKQVIKDIIAAKEKQKKLAIIQIGDNQASNSYVKGKLKDCEEVGIPTVLCKRDKSISQDELDRVVSNLNNDESIGGIIVQLPLPKHLTVNLELIDDDKDVDGFKITSHFVPCTPLGIITYLESQNIEFDGKNAVVIGRSDIVGKPMAKLLQDRNTTVTVCHSHTKDISFYTKHADIIIVATGVRHTLTKDMVGDNMPIVIDVGINRNENNKLCGDCDYYDLVDLCSYISPVPGGVGLLTRLSLIENMTKI